MEGAIVGSPPNFLMRVSISLDRRDSKLHTRTGIAICLTNKEQFPLYKYHAEYTTAVANEKAGKRKAEGMGARPAQ